MKTLALGSNRLRIPITGEQLAAFEAYLDALAEARPRLRVTALTDPDAIQRRHFLEPLALLAAIEEREPLGETAIDIGTGAGFPGVPIKIVRPGLRLTLLDAHAKRAGFLRDLVSRLGLEGVSVVHDRAEAAARDPAHRESYDLALARAVAPLPALVELALPFLRVGGLLAAPKGSGAAREAREAAAALRECGGVLEEVRTLGGLGEGVAPTLVLVRKTAATPERYPRRPGIPAKRPLR